MDINCIHQLDYWEEECSQCNGLKKCQIKPPTKTEFFILMHPPTKTFQQHKITCRNGKPVFYQPPELKAVRQKLEAHLAKHIPDEKYTGPVRLITKWCFFDKKRNGWYKTTKPDTDNLQKMLKDIMTNLGFWKDDAQVASEITEKFWAKIPGIYICIEKLEVKNND